MQTAAPILIPSLNAPRLDDLAGNTDAEGVTTIVIACSTWKFRLPASSDGAFQTVPAGEERLATLTGEVLDHPTYTRVKIVLNHYGRVLELHPS